jgi:DNA repair protein RadC
MVPKDERPRERLLRDGAESLTNAELIAILLRTGVRGHSAVELAQQLLHHCEADTPDTPLRRLLLLTEADVKQALPGIGPAKLCQILAALQLGKRARDERERFVQVELSNPGAVYRHLAPKFSELTQEQFLVILLNAKNHVIDVECVTKGTLTSSLVHPREIFKSAIKRSAHAVILAHNHPSGDPTPSREDREVTRRLIQAGKLIGIEVLDHLVIGDGRYTSFRENGMLE